MSSALTRPASATPTAAFGTSSYGSLFYAGHLLTVWGIALSNLGLGLAVLWSLRHRRRLSWGWPAVAPIVLPLELYVAFLGVSVLFSTDPAASARDLSEVFTLCTLPLGWALIRGEQAVRRLFDLLIATTVLLAGFGLAQYLLTDYGPLDNRIPGPFSHYQTFSGILLLGDLLLIARLVAGRGWRRPLYWLAFVVLNLTILLTLTRGTWVAAFVVLTLVLLMRARRLFIVYLAALLVGGALFAALAPASWNERASSIVDLSDTSNYDRLCMAWAGFHMIAERPLFGIGPDTVKERYPIYRHPTAPRAHVAHLHNTFLQLAAERGLLSLAAYLWLMGVAFVFAWRGYQAAGDRVAGDRSRPGRGSAADLYLGVILALVGFNVAGLFEANWRDTEVQRLMLFLLAVPWCLSGAAAPERTRRKADVT
jgi:O-antigen ligase